MRRVPRVADFALAIDKYEPSGATGLRREQGNCVLDRCLRIGAGFEQIDSRFCQYDPYDRFAVAGA
jgi:hypothetical protein